MPHGRIVGDDDAQAQGATWRSGELLVGEREIKLVYDLLVAAFQTDSTRVPCSAT